MRLQLLLLNLLANTWATKLRSEQITFDLGTSTSYDHVVKLPYATYAGTKLHNGISQWLGVPFAKPPIDDLRFAPPLDPPSKSGIQDAKNQGPLCIATGGGAVPPGQSEDCLYLAVYAPTSISSSSGLPVFVFIQGGGFNSDANPNLNGTGLVEASGNSIIVVTFNYRVGPWGFLAGTSSSSKLPYANNGLRDQRKALQWVQNHISAFGGNPDQVVLGGASAGAASIALHMTAYGGRNDHLFHGAAAESVSFAPILTPSESQYQYDALAKALGCSFDDPLKSLHCLRSKTADELEAQNHNIPYPGRKKPPLFMFNPTLDDDFVTDLTYVAFARGKFVSVPVIIGDDTNGGTVFAPKDANSQEDSDEFLTSQFSDLSISQLAEISKFYPAPSRNCPARKCWWRQISDAYGDMRYMCPSLYISSAVANASSISQSRLMRKDIDGGIATRSLVDSRAARRQRSSVEMRDALSQHGAKSWSYRYNVEDHDQMAMGLGVPHVVELNAIFGPTNVPPGTAPASYGKFQSNENIVPVIQAYWTSFIRTLDPNTHKLEWAAQWDEYYDSRGQPQRLVFQNAGETQMEAIESQTRQRCAYLQSIGPLIKQKV